MAKKDLYETLGVDKNASDADIKKAYKKKASENHPDKQGGNHEAMTDIVHSYQVLKDPVKRDRYDKTGQDNEAPFEKMFQEFVQMVFVKMIDSQDVDCTDMIGNLNKHADTEVRKARMDKEGLCGRINKFKKVIKKIKAKKENRITGILDLNIRDMELHVAQIDEHIKFMGQVIECLNGYSYDFDKPTTSGIRGMTDDDFINKYFNDHFSK
jgi:curved DNA-binding protein CbpA